MEKQAKKQNPNLKSLNDMTLKYKIFKIIKDLCKDKKFVTLEKRSEWMLFGNNNYRCQLSFSAFYNTNQKLFNTSGGFHLGFDEFDLFIKDYEGGDVYQLYQKNQKSLEIIKGEILYYLKIRYGEEKYPKGIYNYFTKQEVEDTPELVLAYLEREYYEKCFLDIEEKYGSIAKADKTINDEILANNFVKKHNINWADFDNQCIRSILFAHFNNNPNISKLVEICNKTMTEEKIKNPKNSRIPLYNFLLKKIGFLEI